MLVKIFAYPRFLYLKHENIVLYAVNSVLIQLFSKVSVSLNNETVG